jgi:hypothetical protein
MPIPADAPVPVRHYILDAEPTRPFRGCDCGAQPPNKTLRFIKANRHLFSFWPLPAKPPENSNVAKTD